MDSTSEPTPVLMTISTTIILKEIDGPYRHNNKTDWNSIRKINENINLKIPLKEIFELYVQSLSVHKGSDYSLWKATKHQPQRPKPHTIFSNKKLIQ